MKKQRIYHFLQVIIAFFIFGCTTNSYVSSTEIVEADPTVTLTITNTLAPTITATHTLTPTITLTVTPDITLPGNPPLPTPEFPSILPRGFFKYSEQDSLIYERILHGRPVTVVFNKDSIFTEAERQEISEYIFDTFLEMWEIFGGYRTQQYLMRFGRFSNPEGETSVGWRCKEQFLIDEKNTQGDWYQPLAHGMFHAWMGGTIKTTNANEVWFKEGSTQYYGNRFASRARYIKEMNFYVGYYNDLLGTPRDISLVESGRFKDNSYTFEDRMIFYRKGALVSYLIDQRMTEQGYNLDFLMRDMYLNFGLEGKPFTTEDVRISLENITKQEWQTFFDSYIYGTEPLPITEVEFLAH